MSRQKARERIDLVLSSMDTIPLYMTVAALWKSKDDTSLDQLDIRIYAEYGRILAEDRPNILKLPGLRSAGGQR